MFILYSIIGPILVFNLLVKLAYSSLFQIATMTNAYDKVREDADGQFMIDRARIIHKILLLQSNNSKTWHSLVDRIFFPKDRGINV